MNTQQIEREFKDKICEQVRLVQEGSGRFLVFTPFTFDDGDHLVVVLRQENSQWVLSDEGHTYMRLSYDIDERNLQQISSQASIAKILSALKVEDRGGELIRIISDGQYGNALYSFTQALLKVAEIAHRLDNKLPISS